MAIDRNEDKIMDDIRKLLAKAESPAASETERELALKMANKKMARHAIDMAMLDASRTVGEKRKPVSMRVVLLDQDSEWGPYFYTLVQNLAFTNRCRVAIHYGYTEMTVVGMQEDVEWVQMLWLQVFFEFVSRIQPRWDVAKDVEENIFIFKNAGYKWKDIWLTGHAAMGGMPDGQDEFIPNKCKYMITGYKKSCANAGVEPVGTQTFAAYKLTFTNHFTWKVNTRLEQMREDNKKAQEETTGSELALVDVSKTIDEEFYLLFPELDPEAARRARKDAEEADAAYLAALSPQVRSRVLRERQAAQEKAAKANERYYRNASKTKTFDAAGAAAGERAGASVNLNRSAPAADSGSRTELGS